MGAHRVVKVQAAVPGQPGDGVGQGPLGQGAGGDQHRLGLVDGGGLFPADGDVGVGLHQSGDPRAEGVPVHRQGPAAATRTASAAGSRLEPIRRISSFSRPEAESSARP